MIPGLCSIFTIYYSFFKHPKSLFYHFIVLIKFIFVDRSHNDLFSIEIILQHEYIISVQN